jgi:hypothetical protein
MQKVFITNVIALLISVAAMAQDIKIAVFDPAGSVDGSIREIVREEISSVIVNTSGYTVLERQLINKVLEENKFQSSGIVEDTQVSEMGKRMGANMVLVSTVTPMGGNYYISCKLIAVETARIEKQRTAQTQRGTGDLIAVIQKITGDMFSATATVAEKPVEKPVEKPSKRQQTPAPAVNIDENLTPPPPVKPPLPVIPPSVTAGAKGTLSVDMYEVYTSDGEQLIKLNKNEVRQLMVKNKYALLLYNRGGIKNMEEAVNIYNASLEQPVNTDSILIAKGRNVYPYSDSNVKIDYNNKTVYRYDKSDRLDKYDVRERMADSYAALRRYNRGQSLNRTGNILLIGGLCIAAGGGVIAATKPFEWRYEYSEYSYYNRTWEGVTFYNYERHNELLGYCMIWAGVAATITGITLKMTGSIPVKKSVRFYNGSLNTISSAEFKFDFTGNGVRLALTF